jgi:hypothetical protein
MIAMTGTLPPLEGSKERNFWQQFKAIFVRRRDIRKNEVRLKARRHDIIRVRTLSDNRTQTGQKASQSRPHMLLTIHNYYSKVIQSLRHNKTALVRVCSLIPDHLKFVSGLPHGLPTELQFT